MVIDMKKDKLVIMDWGGVIESHSEESYLAHNVVKHVLEQFTTEPLPHNFNEVFEQSLMVDGVPINEIAGTKKLQPYLDKLFAACHIEVHPELYIDFMDIYTQITSDTPYDRELARYLAGLQERCYTGILSNLTVLDGPRQNRQLGWEHYDYRWLSYEIGCMKPDLEAYRLVEKDSNMSGSQILFIEDVEENLAIPREKFGWQTYAAQYKGTKGTIDAIERFLAQ
jgi:HAD superfamily hydrolase (TIGR01509 family)